MTRRGSSLLRRVEALEAHAARPADMRRVLEALSSEDLEVIERAMLAGRWPDGVPEAGPAGAVWPVLAVLELDAELDEGAGPAFDWAVAYTLGKPPGAVPEHAPAHFAAWAADCRQEAGRLEGEARAAKEESAALWGFLAALAAVMLEG